MSARSRRRAGLSRNVLALAAAVAAAVAALLVVALRAPERPDSFEERVDAVASTLRCPVCQDLSVADSPSPLAREMRSEVAAQLRAGRSPDEVRAWFVERYGDWILLSPPARGVNLVVWVLPGVLLAAGGLLGFVAVRRWTSNVAGGRPDAHETSISDEDRRRLRAAMAAGEDDPE